MSWNEPNGGNGPRDPWGGALRLNIHCCRLRCCLLTCCFVGRPLTDNCVQELHALRIQYIIGPVFGEPSKIILFVPQLHRSVGRPGGRCLHGAIVCGGPGVHQPLVVTACFLRSAHEFTYGGMACPHFLLLHGFGNAPIGAPRIWRVLTSLSGPPHCGLPLGRHIVRNRFD